MDASPGEEAPKPSLKKLGGAFVDLLHGHLELLGIEFQEEKSRTFRLFLLAGVSLILGLLVLQHKAGAARRIAEDEVGVEGGEAIGGGFLLGGIVWHEAASCCGMGGRRPNATRCFALAYAGRSR